MNRSRLLLVAFIVITFAVAATAFRASQSSAAPAGSLTAAGQMLEPRSGHTATLLPDGKVLIAGGMRRNQDFYKSAELYDPATGKFQPTGEMNERRVSPVAVLLRSGKVLIAGGYVGQGCTDSAELYDPGTGKFTALPARMTTRRGDSSGTLLPDSDVLIAGGADHDSPGGVASAEVFHPATMTFHAVASMHFARVSHTATRLPDGRVLIAGGRGDRVQATAEIYDPKTSQFLVTGDLITARYKHTAGLLPDGRVLIAGGSDERDWRGTMNRAEIYDPRTGKFTAASPLNDSRYKLPDEAVQLPSGKLLVAGGSREVEVYDPASGKFLVAAGQMNDARHFMTETKLKDGRVLLAGGYPDNDQATNQAWIYRP
ncbi:MAG TPA: kelch repeat-containing protein [Candidatus Sulfotelmatobacter sp.]|nr:kelch repeat-containing protein [Candidatus Sulfotelmatobacter sp.]